MLIMKIPFLTGSKQSRALLVVVPDRRGVHFAQMERVGGRPRVVTYAYRQAAGQQVTGLTAAVLEKLGKGIRFGNARVATLLGNGEYQLLQVDAPNVPAEEVKSAVRWSIKDMLGYHIDDAALDVLRIPAGQGGLERSKALYVVAAPRNVIGKRTEMFKRAKIGLRIIDIPEMAQRNIAALFEQNKRTLAVLAFDDGGCLLTLTMEGELLLSRRFDITLGQVQDANESLREQALERLELEVQRSIDNFDRQHSQVSLNRLLVSAPGYTGLVERLGRNLEIPVERLDLEEVMDLGNATELRDEEAQVYALHALGAALREEGRAA